MSDHQLCAVSWCAAIATKGLFCPVHAIDPDLRPQKCESDEIITEDAELLKSQDCDECDGSGEVDCSLCYGDGTCNCSHCDADHDCGECEGSGHLDCEACEGSGKRVLRPGEPRYVLMWAEVKGQRLGKREYWTPDYYETATKRRERIA